jgi:hypothetical protein
MADSPDPADPLKVFYDAVEKAAKEAGIKTNGLDREGWADPDMGVLRLRRRDPVPLPVEVFGDSWGQWIIDAASAASCPPDYVALPLLSSVSALIGNACWAQAAPKWIEPPHLWTAVVGDSGEGKSPGADTLMRDILPVIEHRMIGDFPERHHEWMAAVAADKAAVKCWESEQRAALKAGQPFEKPMPTPTVSDVEPKEPCLRQYDITIEEVAAVLSTAAPKGVVICRDELAGWLDGMNAYNPSGRAFWIEAYGGREYQVARRRHSGKPIKIPRLAVSVCGGTQPERLAKLIADTDDGLLSRIQWGWPNPIPFKLGQDTPNIGWAVEALGLLRELDLMPGDPPRPMLLPLTPEGQQLIEEFGRDMQVCREDTGGLLRSAYGKARGTALRLSLNLEWLWWSGQGGMAMPPITISRQAFIAAAFLVADYFMPMAERVFGDAGATEVERTAATLARWIIKQRPNEVYVRHLQREVRLPGLRTAEQIKKAANALVEADWLRPPAIQTAFGQFRNKVAYPVNPKLYEA